MSLNSETLFQRSQKVAPGGVHSPVRAFKSVGGTPVFFEKAEGAYLYSVEGKRYIDFCQSFGPLILGHRDLEVAGVVKEIQDKAWTFGACEPYSLELAEWIVNEVPWVEKLRFVSSGTEAVMSALRVARAATKRYKTLKFEGCYHGHADSLLVKAGSGLAGESASDSAGVSPQVASETLVCPLNDLEAFEQVMKKHGHEIAVVIIEPLPANFGLLIQTQEFLKEVAKRTQANGSLLCFDEVISGFRVAMGGMAELTGIRPDLVTFGKILGGGFPVGCYGGRKDLMDLVAPSGPVYQAGTLSANPVGMRAGLATLQKVKREKVYATLKKRGEKFFSQLHKGLNNLDLPMKVTCFESLFWIHSAPTAEPRSLLDLPKEQGPLFAKIFHRCLEQGVYLAPSGFEVGFLSLAHTEEILDEAAEVILKSIREVYGKP